MTQLNQNFIHISRTVAAHIVRNLSRIMEDAWNADETGYLDRAVPDSDEAMWMAAVVRFIGYVRAIVEHNMAEPLPQDFVDAVVEGHLAETILELSDGEI